MEQLTAMEGRIPEAEFVAYLGEVQEYIQVLIQESGLSLSDIARATRMTWHTVDKAARGENISMASASRIVFFLRRRLGLPAEH